MVPDQAYVLPIRDSPWYLRFGDRLQTTDIKYQSAILYEFLPSKHEEERLSNSYLRSMPS